MFRKILFVIALGTSATSVQAAPEPHFIVLPGIEGPSPCVHGIISGLRHSHPHASYEIFDWTTGRFYRMLYHACSWNRNQSVAVSLAHHVAAYQREYPDTPIILIGHSGGGAMVVVALEQLPPGYRVHQAILLAPDLDPKHSLGVAMDHTLCGIDVFRSHFDLLVLGVGTSLVGTLDRAHSPAAGLVGFRQPSGLDERSRFLYSAKLREHDYRVEMVLTGHTGGHFTCTTPAFVDRYVSPVIR